MLEALAESVKNTPFRRDVRRVRILRAGTGCRLFLPLAFLLLSFSPGFGQLSAGENDTVNPGVPVTLSATYGLTGVGVPSLDNLEDWVQGPFPIGFNFSFFGNSYSVFYIGANGWVSFSPNPNASGVREPVAIPSSADYSPKNCIMGPFQDLYPMTEGGPYIFFQTIGTAPRRKLVVMWCDCPMYICQDKRVTFQIVLNEEGFTIENHIYHKPSCPENYGNKATLGLQNIDGFTGFPVPGHNASSWTADTLAFQYKPTSVDSFQISQIPYNLQPITPGDKIIYQWYNGGDLVSDQQAFTVTPAQTATYRVRCILCGGQEFYDDVTVFVVPYIPNAFTPNGDGLNDVFRITGVQPENITQFNIQIFNRWGQAVYTSNNILEAWDGKLNGEVCPEGEYVWVMFYENGGQFRTTNQGTLMLLR